MAPDHAESFLKLVRDAKSRVKEENFRDTKKRLDAGEKIVVVDTREDSEWARGHIPGAIHLGKGIIERDIEKPSPTRKRRSCCIAEADSAPRSRRRIFRRWATAM